MFRPAARFLTGPRPPDFFAARFLAAVILPPLLFFAILNELLDQQNDQDHPNNRIKITFQTADYKLAVVVLASDILTGLFQ